MHHGIASWQKRFREEKRIQDRRMKVKKKKWWKGRRKFERQIRTVRSEMINKF